MNGWNGGRGRGGGRNGGWTGEQADGRRKRCAVENTILAVSLADCVRAEEACRSASTIALREFVNATIGILLNWSFDLIAFLFPSFLPSFLLFLLPYSYQPTISNGTSTQG